MVNILSIIHVAIQTDVNSSKQKNTIKMLDHKNTRLGFSGQLSKWCKLDKKFPIGHADAEFGASKYSDTLILV